MHKAPLFDVALLLAGVAYACSDGSTPGEDASRPLDRALPTDQRAQLRDQHAQRDGSAPLPDHARGVERSARLDTGTSPYVYENATVQQVSAWITANQPLALVDVREPSEFSTGHLQNAINLPWSSGVLNTRYTEIPTTKPVVVHCAVGSRSPLAAAFLVTKKYRPVYSMIGGISAWKSAGLPTVK